MSNEPQPTSEAFHDLQLALDRYFEGRLTRIEPLLRERLGVKECVQLQKKHLWRDLARNPINALWAIPYFSVRKVIETCDKLGWVNGTAFFSKIPQALKTDFQKEVERLIQTELFGLTGMSTLSDVTVLSAHLKAEQPCELTAALEACGLQQLADIAQIQVRAAVSEFCIKQNGFTDLMASGGLLIVSQFLFKDRSLDIFAISRRIAARWAKKDAVSHFAFGKNLGRVFYNVAPAPHATTTQIVITTGIAILLLSVVSTAISVFSYPIQRRLGFRQTQLEALMEVVNARLLVELSKSLKRSSKLS